jgi:hypothetical protein
MRVTVSLPDSLARRFQAAVPPRRRSSTVARLLEAELVKREGELAKACAAANADCRLAEEIDEWQAFDDALPPTRPAVQLRKGKA